MDMETARRILDALPGAAVLIDRSERVRLANAAARDLLGRNAEGRHFVTLIRQPAVLEAIERAGVDAPYLCRGGACGQCETDVVESDGTFVHRDHWLTDAEKASGKKIMPCVSRFEGDTLVLDR